MSKDYTEKITGIEEQIERLKNRQRELMQKSKVQERKARTKRLVERGAIAESLIPGADEMTGEQFKSFLKEVLSSVEVQRFSATTARDGNTQTGSTAEASKGNG